MASDDEVLASTVREYFLKNGGKVKRNDLFDHFRGQLDKFDDHGTSKNRFGDIVNSLASLQNIEGEKYFALKKSRNGTTPVLLRRPMRQANQRKDKGFSLPANMRNFRFSALEDASGNLILGDNKNRSNVGPRNRAGFRSESHNTGMRYNNSDPSFVESGQANDSGIDTAVSSLQSESPRDSRQSLFSRNSEYDQMSLNSGDTGIFNEDDHYDGPSNVLTSFEKSWMMSNMTGNRAEIICQLEVDASIVKFKDFIMGYTALHWAAKRGNEELLRLLIDKGAEVNKKSNGGYTPLHLATMHGRFNIIQILIDEYHANVHIRDNTGKEPKDVMARNFSEELKQKLTEPAPVVTEETAKKLSASTTVLSDSSSGFSKYMEPKDSAKIKPKLRAGASFRFLKKQQKKLRRSSDRPVIEHWDSSRQERLESTLEVNEKELYRMQRSNSGSLFPVSFYAGKRPSQPEQEKETTDSVDAGGETNSEVPRERLLSRSYPENEFRNLARISESESHEAVEANPGSSVPLSNPIIRGTSEGDDVFDSIKRRSFSENSLNKPSFKDELGSRESRKEQSSTTCVDNTNARSPSVFGENTTNVEMTVRSKEENSYEDQLTMKIDLSPGRESVDPFNGKELSTFMTVPTNKSEVSRPRNGKLSGNEPGFGEPSKGRTQKKRNVIPQSLQPQGTQISECSGTQAVYPHEQVVSKLNNNYEEVSEILISGKNKEADMDRKEPTSPVRPPRKKDKKLKKTYNVEGDAMEQNVYDFETGKENVTIHPNLKEDFNDAPSAYTRDKNERFTNTSWQDYNRDYTSQYYTRRKSDGFAVEKARSDESVPKNGSNLNSRRKSECFPRGSREKTEEFGSVNFTRPKSEAFSDSGKTDVFRRELAAFKSQKEVSLDHPRRGSFEKALKPDSEFVGRRSEGFVSDERNVSDERREDGFVRQNEVSLDHTRRRTTHSQLPSTNQNQSGRYVLPDVLLDSSRHSTKRTEYHSMPPREDFDSGTQVDERLPPPYRPPPGFIREGSSEQNSYLERGSRRAKTRPSYMPPSLSTAKEPPPYRISQDSRVGYSNPVLTPTTPNCPPLDDVTPIAPPRKHRRSVSSEDSAYPPDELSPTAPPRKHRSSIPRSSKSCEDLSYPPKEMSTTASPLKNQTCVSGSPEILEYRPAEPSPTVPPRKHRGSIPRSTEDFPRASVPTYSPPSFSSLNAVPPRTIGDSQPSHISPPRSNLDYTLRGGSLDHPEGVSVNFEPDDTTVLVARSYNHTENNTRSSNYPLSEPSEYDPSARSSNYRRSDPTGYNGAEYGNFRSNSSYPQTSSFQYSSDSGRSHPSEFSSDFKPAVTRDQLDGYENRSLRDRTAFSNKSRDQSPSGEVVVARSVTSQHDHPTNYPGAFRNDSREPSGYIPTRKTQEMSGDAYRNDTRNGAFAQASHENEFDNVIMPAYEGCAETSFSRPEISNVEPEFIVAKQMSSDEAFDEVTDARHVQHGSREDIDLLPGTLRQDTKNKWVSNSSDGSNESKENSNKYRMTSMI